MRAPALRPHGSADGRRRRLGDPEAALAVAGRHDARMIARPGSPPRKRARSPSSATRCAPGRIGAGRAPRGAPWSAWCARSPTSARSCSVRARRQHRCADAAVAAILRECAREQSAYWGWSSSTWVRILGATQRDFRAVHPVWVDRQVRHYLIALPYLLGCFTDLRPLGNYKRVALAEKVFGPARVQAIVARVATRARRLGLSERPDGPGLPADPLRDAPPQSQPAAARSLPRAPRRPPAHGRAGETQPALSAPARPRRAGRDGRARRPPVVPRPAVEGVSPSWQAWAHRWETTSTLAPATGGTCASAC